MTDIAGNEREQWICDNCGYVTTSIVGAKAVCGLCTREAVE